MRRKPIRVGLDFDGVVAYNPFRVIRAPVSFVKRRFLGVRKLTFYYPTSNFQKFFWKVMHDSSVFPAKGIDLLARLVQEDKVEAHLITARYSFLDDHLDKFLIKHKIKSLFKSINLNKKDEQPHLFKEMFIKKQNLDFFIEDNLDIVKYLHGRVKPKIFWIYNIVDRGYPHQYKFPYLEKALENILENSKFNPD